MHAVPNKIGRVKNAPAYDSARCDIRVCVYAAGRDIRACVHDVSNKIGRVKNAPAYDSARCDIRVCVYVVPNRIGRVRNATLSFQDLWNSKIQNSTFKISRVQDFKDSRC